VGGRDRERGRDEERRKEKGKRGISPHMLASYGTLSSSTIVINWRELLAGSRISMIGLQVSPLYFVTYTLNSWKNTGGSVD